MSAQLRVFGGLEAGKRLGSKKHLPFFIPGEFWAGAASMSKGFVEEDEG